MSDEVFEALCTLEMTLRELGMDELIEALEEGDDEVVERVLESLLEEEKL
jgi:Mg/Co/Ni transporter MgtE